MQVPIGAHQRTDSALGRSVPGQNIIIAGGITVVAKSVTADMTSPAYPSSQAAMTLLYQATHEYGASTTTRLHP